MIEELIGRELTDSEKKTIEWLNGWEKETCKNIMNIIISANEHGRKGSK